MADSSDSHHQPADHIASLLQPSERIASLHEPAERIVSLHEPARKIATHNEPAVPKPAARSSRSTPPSEPSIGKKLFFNFMCVPFGCRLKRLEKKFVSRT